MKKPCFILTLTLFSLSLAPLAGTILLLVSVPTIASGGNGAGNGGDAGKGGHGGHGSKGGATVLMTAKTVKMADILFAMPFVPRCTTPQTLQLSAQVSYQQTKSTLPASWHKTDLRPL